MLPQCSEKLVSGKSGFQQCLTAMQNEKEILEYDPTVTAGFVLVPRAETAQFPVLL